MKNNRLSRVRRRGRPAGCTSLGGGKENAAFSVSGRTRSENRQGARIFGLAFYRTRALGRRGEGATWCLLHGRSARKRERSRAVRFEKERVGECQGGELNSRPRAYESPALPLSYPGLKGAKLIASRKVSTRLEPELHSSRCHSERREESHKDRLIFELHFV